MAKLRVRLPDETVAEINLGKFAGGSNVVDQTYNSESENAQSGKAVAEAIEAALENVPSGGGSVGGTADIASAIKTTNGQTLRFFVGTHKEYEALSETDKNGLFAIISDDATKEELFKSLTDLESRLEELWAYHMGDVESLEEFRQDIIAGQQAVASAEYATQADRAHYATEAEFTGSAAKAQVLETFATKYHFDEGFCTCMLESGCLYAITITECSQDAKTYVFVLFVNGSGVKYSSTQALSPTESYRVNYGTNIMNLQRSVNGGEFLRHEEYSGDFYITKIASVMMGG